MNTETEVTKVNTEAVVAKMNIETVSGEDEHRNSK